MKKMYWHAHNLPRIIMVAFCVFVLLGLFLVEHFKQNRPQPYYQQKLQAASYTYTAFSTVKQLRNAAGIAINPATDPQGSGLIGKQLTDITSDSGNLTVKQTTVNPNIAALFVLWLHQAGVQKGDVVAAGMTGSFPALDLAMLNAIRAIGAKPLLVLSAAASQYGANIPGFSIGDIYHGLLTKNVMPYPVLGMSLGGKEDRAYGMSKKGQQILLDTIKKYHYPFLDSKGTLDGINKRMAIYNKHADGKPIAAYINVGGGMASIGLKRIPGHKQPKGKLHSLKTGVITRLPIELVGTDSVAVRFLKQGVPVVNVHNVGKVLVEQYGFPRAPRVEPFLGEGGLFNHKEYNTWLAIAVLVLDVIVFIIIAVLSKKYVIRYKRSQ